MTYAALVAARDRLVDCVLSVNPALLPDRVERAVQDYLDAAKEIK